jgi:RNA polymerase-binding transcription factor DksA
MLNLSQQTIQKIKRILLRQQKEVSQQLKTIKKEDPVLEQGPPEASESGTDSWQADVHGRLMTLSDDLSALLGRIKSSLLRLSKGTYGKCEKCGKEIEPARLKALPTASLCVACSKLSKFSKLAKTVTKAKKK